MTSRAFRSLTLGLLSVASLVACSSDDSSPASSGGDAGGADGSGLASDAAGSSGADAASPGSDAASGTDGGGGAMSEAGVGSEAGTESDAAVACAYPDGGAVAPVKYVFVIAMENKDINEVFGDFTDAPYINGSLLPCYANAANFDDPLPIAIPSEPHYVWMEAGTNTFPDATFTTDDDPSAQNSTASTLHLATQLTAKGVSWRAYEQSIDAATTGACPIYSSGVYAAKHDPFVFFQDVAGSPPAAGTSTCTSHHAPFTQLAGDLTSSQVAQYNFITPDLCNDMHGNGACTNSNLVQAGDQFLRANLPSIVSFAYANAGVVFIVWDEGDLGTKIPFLAIGPSVKPAYSGSVTYTHSSLLATVERIFGVSRLATVAAANDLGDLFQTGALP